MIFKPTIASGVKNTTATSLSRASNFIGYGDIDIASGNNLNILGSLLASVNGNVTLSAATGAQGKKGKITTSETTTINQVSSNFNFNNDLNIQSASDTTITASNLTADTATILTGKLRDPITDIDTITNADATLTTSSAFNTSKTDTRTDRVKPSYVGIAVVSGVGSGIAHYGKEWLVESIFTKMSPELAKIIGIEIIIGGIGYQAESTKSNINPENKSLMDPILNNRSSQSISSQISTEIKTDLNFNNLITQ